jgi:hypothetical protein
VLQLVTVARLRFEEAEEGAGNVHDADYTSKEYFERIVERKLAGPWPG